MQMNSMPDMFLVSQQVPYYGFFWEVSKQPADFMENAYVRMQQMRVYEVIRRGGGELFSFINMLSLILF